MPEGDADDGKDVLRQAQKRRNLCDAVPDPSDEAAAEPEGFKRREGVLGHDARVKAADEELLDPAEVGLGAEQLKAVVVGAEDPEFRCGCDMGLTARELREPSSKCWIGDADDACHLQCAGCGRGARRIEDLRAQFGRDGLVGEGAHGAVRELGSDRVVHYELLKGDASSLAFLPVREYRRSRI